MESEVIGPGLWLKTPGANENQRGVVCVTLRKGEGGKRIVRCAVK